MTTPLIRPAGPRDLASAAATLASAFADYPWTRWSIPAADHLDRLERLQRIYLGHALAHGVVLVDDAVDAVVALLPPDAPAPEQAAQQDVVRLHGDRLAALTEVELPARRQGSWDLATLGVRPGRRGAGLGSAAIRAALDAVAQRRGGWVTLETSDVRNVRLYERHGFTTVARTHVPLGPEVFSMERGPDPT